MEIIDKKKLDTVILYLQRITDGKNPVNNMPAEDDTVLNNPNVIRCMYFVKEILEEVKRNNCYIGKGIKKSAKQEFPIDVLAEFAYREDMPISGLVRQMNELVDDRIYQKLTYKPILQWLKDNGLLMEEFHQEFNKTVTLSTEKGWQIGIRAEKRNSLNGVAYMGIYYNMQAQEYIAKNIETIIKRKEK